jgi:hypothetical protein
MFFAEQLGARGKVGAGVGFGICVDLVVNIEVLPGTATHLTAWKVAIVSWGGGVG